MNKSTTISPRFRRFIEAQELFFVATAPASGRVNVSPKGLNTLRVIDDKTVAYLDLTGSGNETAAHVMENGRITFMFCAFSGQPMILRLYGEARIVLPRDDDWLEWLSRFPLLEGTRQVFIADIQYVASSCGFGIPIYELVEPRSTLIDWAHKKGSEKLEQYRQQMNVRSIDGLPTGYPSKASEGAGD